MFLSRLGPGMNIRPHVSHQSQLGLGRLVPAWETEPTFQKACPKGKLPIPSVAPFKPLASPMGRGHLCPFRQEASLVCGLL